MFAPIITRSGRTAEGWIRAPMREGVAAATRRLGDGPAERLLLLQRSIGNRAVCQLLARGSQSQLLGASTGCVHRQPATAPAGPANQSTPGTTGSTAAAPTGGTPANPAGDLDAPPMAATNSTAFFAHNSSDLTPDDKASLQAFVDRYVAAATPTPIVLIGFASVDGDATTNERLAQRRADAVKAFMAATIKAELITATGQGPTAQFQSGLAAANRRVNFLIATPLPSASPPASDTKDPQAGGPQKVATKPPQKISVQVDPPPKVPMTDPEFTKIFGAGMLAQLNALHTKDGPVPPSGQLSLTLTINGTVEQPPDGATYIRWLEKPSIAVVFNSSGPVAANDQEAINLFRLHWGSGILRSPVEVSVLGVTQNLFTKGASVQGGVQPQVQVNLRKPFALVLGGSFMLGDADNGKFGLNASGFLGLNISLFGD
jgi:outer membrane protein OmpA-like peptidoglycan-associated protein